MIRSRLVCPIILLLLICTATTAQTTGFTYQGSLSDGGTTANGLYDLQFTLWDSASGGTMIGVTQTVNAVNVSNGIFSLTLDFGGNAFPGAARFLEISARQASAGSFTLLTPRQQISSTPYAIRSASSAVSDMATNATQLGGLAANQYAQTSDSRLSDSRVPTAGSPAYIQNTNSQQTANFNINGNGTAGGTMSANIVNAATQINLNGTRVLHAPGTGNLFAGASAGAANTTGQRNSFFGALAGLANTGGNDNAFFGNNAGQLNTGTDNSFFGSGSGAGNVSGIFNSFFGKDAGGALNQDGSQNSFFGHKAGAKNTASDNAFFGASAGAANTVGGSNSFFGTGAGLHNTNGGYNVYLGTFAGYSSPSGFANIALGGNAALALADGDNNTIIGFSADLGAGNLENATAIGARSRVDQNNSLVLGSIAGVNFATEDTKVGIDTTTPAFKLTVKTGTGNYGVVHTDGTIILGTYVGGSANGGYLGTKSNHSLNFFVNDGAPSLAIEPGGTVKINTLGSAGGTSLCRNASNQISTCSSSLRYKTNIQAFRSGLSVINRLQPITFAWKADGVRDLGLGAEDVAKVEPLLTFQNDRGEIEGVKYSQLSVLLINAVKEQQEQIVRQQEQIKQQQQALSTQQQAIKRLQRLVNHNRPDCRIGASCEPNTLQVPRIRRLGRVVYPRLRSKHSTVFTQSRPKERG